MWEGQTHRKHDNFQGNHELHERQESSRTKIDMSGTTFIISGTIFYALLLEFNCNIASGNNTWYIVDIKVKLSNSKQFPPLSHIEI